MEEKNTERINLIRSRHDSEISVLHANPAMICKTCKYSGHLFSGEVLDEKSFDAGSCEVYEIKPISVYFDGNTCPKYIPVRQGSED